MILLRTLFVAVLLFSVASLAQPGQRQQPSCGSFASSFLNFTTDPELTFLNQLSAQDAKLNLLLNVLNSSMTWFFPTDDALVQGIKRYSGIDVAKVDIGKFQEGFLSQEGFLWLYRMLDGSYTPESLVNLGTVNSMLGIVKQQDFVVKAFTDASGQLFVQSLANNDTARVLASQEVCNSYVVYKLDKLLLPAESTSDLSIINEDAATVAKIIRDSSSCAVSLPESLSGIGTAQRWLEVWNTTGMLEPLTNTSLASTIFVPQNEGVISAGPQAATASAVMYSMLPGEWCVDDLVSAGSKNSMLGEVVGREIPLRFSKIGEELLVIGEFGRALVLKRSMGCHSVVYIIDAPLLPPPDVDVPAPQALPTNQTRHITCNPAVYLQPQTGAIQPALMPTAEETTAPSSTSDSNNAALAIGLGIGLGCAALATGVAIAIIYRRRQSVQVVAAVDTRAEGFSTDHPTTSEDTPMQPATARSSTPALNVFGSPRSPGSPGFFSVTEFSTVSSATAARSAPEKAPLTQASRTPPTDMLTHDLWEIDPEDVEIHLDDNDKPIELGRGSFGAVYSGTLRGVQPAAIKVLNASVGDEAEAAFQQEAAILMHINRDRNVVQLYGSCKMPDGRLLLVMELMEGGDLRRALNRPESADALAWHRQGKGVALNIARGLTALHAVNVVHRDLKSKNVLLSGDFQTAKIGDVGISAVQSKGYLTATAGQVVGTLAWSAPELLLGQRCTEKIDVYSLGIVLFELATGKAPQRGLTQPPPPSERCPAGLAALIKACTSPKPRQRPSAREVHERILGIPPVAET